MKHSQKASEKTSTTLPCSSVSRTAAPSPLSAQTAMTQQSAQSVAGIVYSEFALANPSAWAYHRPILEENQGWAAFVTTPRGRNFAFSMFQFASQSPEWFCELLTAKDTGAVSDTALAETLREYKALYGEDAGDAQYRQEYFCDWNAAILGGYFTGECAQVRAEGRILAVDAIDKPVNRAWDLGRA